MAYNDERDTMRHGMATVLLTRPRAQSERFAEILRDRFPRISVEIAPLMEIVPAGEPAEFGTAAGVIFSSVNGVAHAGQGMGLPAFCVGPQTTDAARVAGFDARCAGRTADELVTNLLAARPHGPLLHLHGHHQRGDIVARLKDAGLAAEGHITYDQVPVHATPEFSEILSKRPLLVPLFSPRSAELFATAAQPDWGPQIPEAVHLIALSPAVADTLPPSWRDMVGIAEVPDRNGMLDGIGRQVYP